MPRAVPQGRDRLAPVSDVARSNLGATLTGQRKYEEATREVEQAVALRPGYAEAVEFRRALALNPHFLEARRNLDQAEGLLR